MGPGSRSQVLACPGRQANTLQFLCDKRLAMAMTVELEQHNAGLPQAETATPATGTPRAQALRWTSFARPALGLLLPVTLALIWEFIVWRGWSTGRLVPPPSKIFACRPGQASTCERDPGPITAGSSDETRWGRSVLQQQRPVVMGPRSRAQLRTKRGRQLYCCASGVTINSSAAEPDRRSENRAPP
jgi:hypothetical protein